MGVKVNVFKWLRVFGQALIKQMLSHYPTERPTLADVITALNIHYQQFLTQHARSDIHEIFSKAIALIVIIASIVFISLHT